VFAGLAPARRRLVLAVLALLAVGVVALAVVLLVPGAAGSPPRAADQRRPGPVLLVPGYGGSTSSLQVLAARLTDAGRDATVVGLPGNGTGDLSAAADALGQAARAALARTGADSVDVVGYSAGGVVARLWVADDGAGIARRVVTLGSPHHGTTLADLAGSVAPGECPQACQELTTGSALLRQLNSGDETPEGPTWVSIWTEQDETVTPPDSARLEGALDIPVQSVCAGAQVGHGGLPSDPLVGAMVLTELAAGAPVPLTAADCSRLAGQ
jgi:triacylglycerol lipase